MPTLPDRTSRQIVFSGGIPFNSTTAALPIDPAQTWIGNDGPWSPVLMGIGTPRQFVSVLISTTANQPWAVLKSYCQKLVGTPQIACQRKRGGLYSPDNSTTWNSTGLYTLESEANLGINASARVGRETVQLGVDGSRAGSFSLPDQTIAGIVNVDFWVATWGIRPDTTNLTTLENRSPSLLSNLKTLGKISSLSWGYTAGAIYRYGTRKTAAVSLTLGGTDTSRYEPHNVTFDMILDPSRDLVVGIRSAKTNITDKPLIPTPFLSLLDAGVSQIWLPKDACQAFEDAFNLTYNETLGLYPVNDTLHQSLLSQNPSITFTLGNDLSSSPTVDITFPYASFDLLLTTDYPGISEPTRYFPLRRAANATQYTLGRTFFQEAYVIADYERFKFSVHQTVYPGVSNETLVAISAAPTPSGTSISTGAAVGIAIGVVVLVVMLLGIAYRFRRKAVSTFYQISPFHTYTPPGKLTQEMQGSDTCCEAPGNRPIVPEVSGREQEAEMDSNSRHELPNGDPNANELETSSITSATTLNADEVFELPGSEYSDLEKIISNQKIGTNTLPKIWLCQNYVNQDYAVEDDSASAETTLYAANIAKSDHEHDEACPQPATALEAHSVVPATTRSGPNALPSEEDNGRDTAIRAISPSDTPSSREQKWHAINSDIPRFASPAPMIDDGQKAGRIIDGEIYGACANAALKDPLESRPGHCSAPDPKSSLQSSSSMVSELSPHSSVDHADGSIMDSLTLNILPQPPRKDSIVSPL